MVKSNTWMISSNKLISNTGLKKWEKWCVWIHMMVRDSVTWWVLHSNHKVVVGRAHLLHGDLSLAGIKEGRTVSQVLDLRAALLALSHHAQSRSHSFIQALIQALSQRGGAPQLDARISCEVDLDVLQLGLTPVLQLIDEGGLFKGQQQPHTRPFTSLWYMSREENLLRQVSLICTKLITNIQAGNPWLINHRRVWESN